MKFTKRPFDNNKKLVVKTARWELWLAVFALLLFSVLMILLVSESKGDTSYLAAYIGGGLLLGVILCSIIGCIAFKITVDGASDHFVYRTCFFRTYKIKYSDCLYYKPFMEVGRFYKTRIILIKTAKKRFFVDERSVNSERFFLMLKANGVPFIEKDVSFLSSRHASYEVSLKKSRAAFGVYIGLLGIITSQYLISRIYTDVVNGTFGFKDIFFYGLFAVLSLFFALVRGPMLVITPFSFRISVFGKTESFTYRTVFNKSYNIMYKDCICCKKREFLECYVLKTKIKTFYIDTASVNCKRFIDTLYRKKVKIIE